MDNPKVKLGSEDRALFDKEQDLPALCYEIYHLYWVVRGKDGFSWTELKSYCDLWNIEITGMDLKFLEFIDSVVTIKMSEREKRDRERAKKASKGKNIPKKGRR